MSGSSRTRRDFLTGKAALEAMLLEGELDCLLSVDEPPAFRKGQVHRLFPDFGAEERAQFQRTGLYPIPDLPKNTQVRLYFAAVRSGSSNSNGRYRLANGWGGGRLSQLLNLHGDIVVVLPLGSRDKTVKLPFAARYTVRLDVQSTRSQRVHRTWPAEIEVRSEVAGEQVLDLTRPAAEIAAAANRVGK